MKTNNREALKTLIKIQGFESLLLHQVKHFFVDYNRGDVILPFELIEIRLGEKGIGNECQYYR
jgi:hypothetical protein